MREPDFSEGENLRTAITSLHAAVRRMRLALQRGQNTKDAARATMRAIDELQNTLPAEEEI